jgi:hypothetical protein
MASFARQLAFLASWYLNHFNPHSGAFLYKGEQVITRGELDIVLKEPLDIGEILEKLHFCSTSVLSLLIVS